MGSGVTDDTEDNHTVEAKTGCFSIGQVSSAVTRAAQAGIGGSTPPQSYRFSPWWKPCGGPRFYMSIRHLLSGRSTLDQLRILMNADRVLADRCGRYFGGELTDEEIEALLSKEGRR